MAVNKVVQSNGTTLIDISPTTAVESDVASGKVFFLANGNLATGTGSGGGGMTAESIIPEQTVNCSIDIGDGSYGGFIQNQSEYPINGTYYRVTYDGTEYIAIGHDVASSITVIGDYYATTSTTYLEFPFAIIFQAGSLFYLAVQGSGTHTLKVDKILSW